MPSEECFVYITLPGQTEPVTAGRYQLDTGRHGTPVGQFVYGRSYLSRSDRVEFDPVELKLQVPVFRTTKLRGNFGALRDSSPDSWGRKLIEKRLGNVNPTEMEYLLNSPDDRAGALGFGLNVQPPAAVRKFNRTLDLANLIGLADQIVAAEKDPEAPKSAGIDAEQAEALLRAGTSMGGARPKATVEDDDALWLAKFPHRDDRWNNPRVEHAMLALARNCEISCAESRMTTVGDRDVLLVKRFDRHKTEKGYLRSRMASGLTLIDADDSPDTADKRQKWSCLLLADEIRRAASGNQAKDLPELFRRVCFNALISNTDDHPRNHAVVAKDTAWSLSPAYDLTPKPMIALRRDLAMAFGDWGRYANRTNLLSQCERFLVSKEEAARIIDGMIETINSSWYATTRQAGVSERDCELIRGAFVYEGFGYDLTDPNIAADDAEELPSTRPRM
jgi:serine/threonine-protein kinase HipA